MPIIRTFAPFVAGVAEMPYSRFAAFNIFGGIGWVILMTLAGYFLGNIPFIRAHFEKVVILIVLVSVLPIVIEFVKSAARLIATKAIPTARIMTGSRFGFHLIAFCDPERLIEDFLLQAVANPVALPRPFRQAQAGCCAPTRTPGIRPAAIRYLEISR